MYSLVMKLLGVEQVKMIMPSGIRTMGAEWVSRVRKDKWGARYAMSHDRSWIILNIDGTTGDTHLYGTRWEKA